MIVRLLGGTYRWVLRPLWPGGMGATRHCRFEPTCSRYAQEAITVARLAARLLARAPPARPLPSLERRRVRPGAAEEHPMTFQLAVMVFGLLEPIEEPLHLLLEWIHETLGVPGPGRSCS